MDVEIEFVPTDWKTLVNGIVAGGYYISGSASIQAKRMKAAGYSDSYMAVVIKAFTTEEKASRFDGWDSMDYDSEYFNSLEIAINSIWIRNALNDVFDFVDAMKHSTKVKHLDQTQPNNPTESISIDSLYWGKTKTNVFNPDRLVSILRNDIYPTLSGSE